MEDADSRSDTQALQDMLTSMVPAFAELQPSDQRRVGSDLVTVARDHAAYRVREAERARARRQQARQASRKPLVPPAATPAHAAPPPVPAPATSGVSAPPVTPDDPRVALLHELQPGFPAALLPSVVERFNGNMETAAAFLLQPGALAKQEAYVESLRQRELQRMKDQEDEAKVGKGACGTHACAAHMHVYIGNCVRAHVRVRVCVRDACLCWGASLADSRGRAYARVVGAEGGGGATRCAEEVRRRGRHQVQDVQTQAAV